MKWCARCVLPDSRPNLWLDDDGVCNACRLAEHKQTIDWDGRRSMFAELVERVRSRGADYDCVIPVSGGKDSTWQLVTCLEHGLRPLALTWRPPARTAIGRANLDNLISLGADHLDVTVNPRIEAAFMRTTYERAGDPAIPMHMAIFALPLSIAVRFGIPLIVWGENSALEYGGTLDEAASIHLDEEWVRRFGATQGTTAADWAGEGLPLRALSPYVPPSAGQVGAAGVEAVFLGSLLGWDPQESLRVAEAHGFRRSDAGAKTGFYDYADIDDDFISVHHYLKWHKFGFTRLFDNLSLEIRAGRMSRPEAIGVIRDCGHVVPHDDIAAFCDFAGLTVGKFHDIAERFRSPDVWTRRDGRHVIEHFLVEDWEWE